MSTTLIIIMHIQGGPLERVTSNSLHLAHRHNQLDVQSIVAALRRRNSSLCLHFCFILVI